MVCWLGLATERFLAGFESHCANFSLRNFGNCIYPALPLPVSFGDTKTRQSLLLTSAGLEIYISRQWTIGLPVLEIWWSCQISGGPDVANVNICLSNQNTADILYLFLNMYKAFEQYLQYITSTEKD